eukprot:4244954-Prorocentrum_lima.AAC.1
MTSSLVGSEMCIRDRAKPMLPLEHWVAQGWAIPGLRPECAETDVQIAVSYTHLTLPTICSV